MGMLDNNEYEFYSLVPMSNFMRLSIYMKKSDKVAYDGNSTNYQSETR